MKRLLIFILLSLIDLLSCSLSTSNSVIDNNKTENTSTDFSNNYTVLLYSTGTILEDGIFILHDGETLKLPIFTSLNITREGYRFLGWADKPFSNIVKYNDGDSLVIKSNLTLYAIWQSWTESKVEISVLNNSDLIVTFDKTETQITFQIDNSYNKYIWKLDDDIVSESNILSVCYETLDSGIHTVYLETQKGNDDFIYSYYAQIRIDRRNYEN